MASKQLSRKEFFDKDEDYYVLDIDALDEKVIQTIEDVLEHKAQGWDYATPGCYCFQKSKDKNLVKGSISWDHLTNHVVEL